MWLQFKHHYLIITYAIMLHLVWAIALAFDNNAGNATAIHTLLHYVSVPQATMVYFVVAIAAFVGLFFRKLMPKIYCLLPQQFIMMLSAGGAAYAMYLGQFADGVQRSHAFLIADQSPAVIAALLHTYAIILIIKESIGNGRNRT